MDMTTMMGNISIIWQSLPSIASLGKVDVRLLLIVMIILIMLYIGFNGEKNKSRKRIPSAIITVNCWFCNKNNKIKSKLENCWYCKHCEQYNGFTEDGDYNREIPLMHSHQQHVVGKEDLIRDTSENPSLEFSNGGRLCDSCNRMQILKIKQIASFVSKSEDTYDDEIEEYRNQLERRYKICNGCSAMLEKYIRDQDMQIKSTNSDYEKILDLKDDSKDEDKEPVKSEASGWITRKILSLLWPSNFLSMVSFSVAWCLLLSSVTGVYHNSFRRFFFFGCVARLALWLLNPFSKRKLLLLITWLFLFILAPMKLYVGNDFLWLRIVIVISESWNLAWHLLKAILLIPFRGVMRIKRTASVASKVKRVRQKTMLLKRPKGTVHPEEKARVATETKRRRIKSDNIDGRIGTMSLGLTDSEDETGQIRREKAKRGSWFASASRFVNETDTSKLSRQENLNAEQNKFQLQPSRLYPLLNVVQRGGPPTPQDKEHGKAVKQIQTSELRRRELLSDEASEKCRTDRDNIQRTSDRRSDYKGLLKSIIKLFFIFAVVFSVVLNIYLLKIFTDRNRKNN